MPWRASCDKLRDFLPVAKAVADSLQQSSPGETPRLRPVNFKQVLMLVPELNSESWLEAPRGPNDTTLQVGFRIGWERISEVSTLHSTCRMNIAVPPTTGRTLDSSGGKVCDLPPLIWGPEFVLTNKYGTDMQVFDEVFALANENGDG